MGAALDLLRARRIAVSGMEVSRLAIGDALWIRPALISDFYGSANAGNVVIDWRLDEPSKMTVTGGRISALVNDGGAGAVFNMTGLQGEEPSLGSSSGASFARFADAPTDGRTYRALRPASSPQFVGRHIIMPIRMLSGGDKYLFGDPNKRAVALAASGANYLVRAEVGALRRDTGSFAIPVNEWAILEVRLLETSIGVWLNGAKVAQGLGGHTSLLASLIGTGYGDKWIGSLRYKGDLGRLIVMIADNPDTIYPAIPVARQLLSGIYGVAMAAS